MDKDILINIAKKSIERKFNNKINIEIHWIVYIQLSIMTTANQILVK